MFTILPIEGSLSVVEGVFCDGVNSGIKPKDNDLGFIYSSSMFDIESVFTTNKFQAAPIKHYLDYPKDFQTNFLLLNSKNANAMTGEAGYSDIVELLDTLKEKFPQIKNPIMSSTGVIGSRLNKEKITKAFEKFDLNSINPDGCNQAIMTTDAFMKNFALKVELDGGESFNIAGICKGAGMINPAMATMLCFVVTDADIPKEDMKEILKESTELSFNAISVDGDTSTNDTVMLMTNRNKKAYDKEAFKEALKMLTKKLALDIVSDGEGAKKVVAFEVKGAKNDTDAEIAAKLLSNSLLVKTAIFGEDPNWGRIASTIGASGIECDESKLSICYDDVSVYENGQNLFTPEVEERAFKVMKQKEFRVICDIGLGEGSFVAYGCDLGYEYVKINADYRT
jgi:glutamate N-acetyltransferase/amino-acid N-acetyltransferase